jgi:DNA-binding FadR family transcriptional regulator
MEPISTSQTSQVSQDKEFERAAFNAITEASKNTLYLNVRDAFTHVKTYVMSQTWTHYWRVIKSRIEPVMADIELVLYGALDDPDAQSARARYNVTMTQTGSTTTLTNAQYLLNDMLFKIMVPAGRIREAERAWKEPWWV